MKRGEVVPVLITHPDAYKLQAFIARERARGALIPMAPVTLAEPGLYGVWVEQYRPVQAAWVQPFRIGAAITTGLAGVAGLVWLVVSVLPLLLGIAGLLAAGWLLIRRGRCTITHHRG